MVSGQTATQAILVMDPSKHFGGGHDNRILFGSIYNNILCYMHVVHISQQLIYLFYCSLSILLLSQNYDHLVDDANLSPLALGWLCLCLRGAVFHHSIIR